MSEREGFLQAIAENPDDDVARLVFADWLDERDDLLGEFIRLQFALEPLRRPCADPLAEMRRVQALHGIPPGKAFPDDDWTVARQLRREEELLRNHKATWLGNAAPIEADGAYRFQPEFRRGFVSSASIGLTALREHGPAVRRGCPALQRLAILGTLGRGEELAACSAVAGLSEVVLAGWLDPNGAEALLKSPHWAAMRSLTVWIGAAGDEQMCRMLTRLPGLHELRLVQMWGGFEADDPMQLGMAAESLVTMVRKERPDLLVHLERPFDRLFPLDGIHIGYGIDAGHLPGGQPVLINEDKNPVVMYFDGEGRFVREERLKLGDKLVKPPPYSWETCDGEELIELLGREVGFVPGPIFVRAFWSELAGVGVQWGGGIYPEELANPSTTDPEESEDIGSSLYWWWSTNQFELPFGNDYWADGQGRVHSS